MGKKRGTLSGSRFEGKQEKQRPCHFVDSFFLPHLLFQISWHQRIKPYLTRQHRACGAIVGPRLSWRIKVCMAFLATCCASMSSCCVQIPCLNKCCGWFENLCGDSNEAGKEMIQPLVAPSPSTMQAVASSIVVASPTIANSIGRNDDQIRPMKKRSVSFMLGPAVEEASGLHNTPGSPTKGIIKKVDYRTPEELL